MLFRQFFDRDTCTYTYLLADPMTKAAVLIDSVREHVVRDLALIDELGLTLTHVLETHVHADHVTAAGVLAERTGCKSVVGRHGGAPCADFEVGDGDVVRFGNHALSVLETPGHTNGCITYVTADKSMAFTGDALLIRGCGRTDFQEGSSEKLYASVHGKIFALPDTCLIYPGHDYRGRTVSTVREEKLFNPRLGGGKSLERFAEIMDGLDLAPPARINEAVPANKNCGRVAAPVV